MRFIISMMCLLHAFVVSVITPHEDIASNLYLHHQNICLSDTSKPLHNVNVKSASGSITIKGGTFWINEYMAVGHIYLDLVLLQLLRSVQIDNIILQRAPCATQDLCLGVGTWESFFKFFYSTAITAANSSAALYVRFKSQDNNWTPLVIGKPSNRKLPSIPVNPAMCFEQLYRRVGSQCVPNTLSTATIRDFKLTAYRNHYVPIPATLPSPRAQVVSVVYRGENHVRSLENHLQLVEILKSQIKITYPTCKIDVNVVDISKEETIKQQVAIFAGSDVTISTHGAVQSNIVYVRDDSVWIELRGSANEYHVEGQNFANLAQNFLVKYEFVEMSSLKFHKQSSYTINDSEIKQVVDKTLQYLQKCA